MVLPVHSNKDTLRIDARDGGLEGHIRVRVGHHLRRRSVLIYSFEGIESREYAIKSTDTFAAYW